MNPVARPGNGSPTLTAVASSPKVKSAPAPLVAGIPPRARLHVVTGKGGTGKTTVAAALALTLADTGRKVLLVEVEGRQALAQLFDIAALAHADQHLAAAPGGGEIVGLSIDPEEALIEYLD